MSFISWHHSTANWAEALNWHINCLGEEFLTSTTIYVLSRNMKNSQIFLSEKFHFLVVKFSVYLNRRVLVMNIIWAFSGPWIHSEDSDLDYVDFQADTSYHLSLRVNPGLRVHWSSLSLHAKYNISISNMQNILLCVVQILENNHQTYPDTVIGTV